MSRKFLFFFLLTTSCCIYAADFLLNEFSLAGGWSNIENRYEVVPDLEMSVLTQFPLTETVTMNGNLRFSILADGIFFGADNTNDIDIENLKDAFAEGQFSIDILIRQFDIVFHLKDSYDIGIFGWRGEKLGNCAAFIQKSTTRLTNGPLYSRTSSPITEFDGIHPLTGVGAYVGRKLANIPLDLRFYAYTNPSAYISFDSRCIFTSEKLLLDSFFGISINGSQFSTNPIRFGVSTLCSNQSGAELFIETGVTKLTVGDNDNYKNWYCFFEPRLQMEYICISMAFFHHPEYYNGEQTNNGGAIDWNIIRIAFGNYLRSPGAGGIELTARYIPAESPKMIVTPFVAYKAKAILWEAAFDLYPFGLADEPKKSIEFKLSIKGVI